MRVRRVFSTIVHSTRCSVSSDSLRLHSRISVVAYVLAQKECAHTFICACTLFVFAERKLAAVCFSQFVAFGLSATALITRASIAKQNQTHKKLHPKKFLGLRWFQAPRLSPQRSRRRVWVLDLLAIGPSTCSRPIAWPVRLASVC